MVREGCICLCGEGGMVVYVCLVGKRLYVFVGGEGWCVIS